MARVSSLSSKKGASKKGASKKGASKKGARGAGGKTRAAAPAAERRTTRLDVDARRTQLLELGLEHFSRESYDDVSIDAIAHAAGISKGLLYHYFPTKRAFYAATVRIGAEQLLAETTAAADTADDPFGRLIAAVDAYLHFVEGHARAFIALMRSGVGMGSEIADVIDKTRNNLVANLTGGLDLDGDASARPFGDLKVDAPIIGIALRGWIGFAETASLAWLAVLDASARASANEPAPGAARTVYGASEVTRDAMRELLVKTLINLLQSLSAS